MLITTVVIDDVPIFVSGMYDDRSTVRAVLTTSAALLLLAFACC
jgi:hypothetical protein